MKKDFEKLNLLMDIGIRHVVQLWGRGLLSGLYETILLVPNSRLAMAIVTFSETFPSFMGLFTGYLAD
jgi:hypothetical protein